MDSLALLCNLHADGPTTLLSLRRAGFDSLAALRRLEPALLARTLDWNERVAERFLREATHLAARTGDFDEGEEPFELESTLVEELDGASDEAEGEADESEPEADARQHEEERREEPALGAQGVEALLGAWRELDRVAPPGAPTEFVIPRPPSARHDRRLDECELEGLTPELRSRLAGKGVRTLRELAEAAELELARGLGLGFTRVKRLQFLARKALADATPVSAARFEAYAPPPAEPFETAGPFA